MRRAKLKEAVAGEELVVAGDKGTDARLRPIPVRELYAVKDKAAYRESLLELIEQARAVPELDPKSLEKILRYDEGLPQGGLTVPSDFAAPRTEIEELLSNAPDETEVRRKVVRALCRLMDSLPVLDPRSTKEILSDEGEGFF